MLFGNTHVSFDDRAVYKPQSLSIMILTVSLPGSGLVVEFLVLL